MNDVSALFRRYRDDVYRLALSFTRSPEEAEDVCQTVFLKLMEQRSLIPGKEKAWLMQVTANECRDLLRSSWWKKTAPLDEAIPAAPLPDGEVLRAVMGLKPKYRVVIYLHYYEGCSTEEIARMLHITRSGVTSRLSRARQILKQELQEV